jgi:nucleoside-diphosphate-sugar epimerase
VISTETIITEASEWNPEKQHSDYAISKYGAEMEVLCAQQEGLDVIIVNPGVIIGPIGSRKWRTIKKSVWWLVLLYARNNWFYLRY